LADILVVVKYHLPGGVREKNSILYQVKMAGQGSTRCTIDQTQLELLATWPTFEFGKGQGGPIQHTVQPIGLEFGSYMLEPRNPNKRNYAIDRCYGVVPTAHMVRSEGPTTVDLKHLPYTRGDAQGLFSLLAFEIGEHDSNATVKNLVDALYRYVGLTPDPPNEFDDYSNTKGIFLLIEIRVEFSPAIKSRDWSATLKRGKATK
jgi:hypothetical protein